MCRLTAAVGGVVLMAPLAEACSVCLGAKGQPVTEAAGGAIVFLLAVVVCVMAGFGAFAMRLFLRGRKAIAGEGEGRR